MRNSEGDNYFKYYSNLVDQCWYNQRIIVSKCLETLIEVSKRLAKKEKKFIVSTYKIKQCWNTRQYLIRFDSTK